MQRVQEEQEEMELQNKALQLKVEQMDRQSNTLQEDNERLSQMVDRLVQEEYEANTNEEEKGATMGQKHGKKGQATSDGMDQYLLYLKDF